MAFVGANRRPRKGGAAAAAAAAGGQCVLHLRPAPHPWLHASLQWAPDEADLLALQWLLRVRGLRAPQPCSQTPHPLRAQPASDTRPLPHWLLPDPNRDSASRCCRGCHHPLPPLNSEPSDIAMRHGEDLNASSPNGAASAGAPAAAAAAQRPSGARAAAAGPCLNIQPHLHAPPVWPGARRCTLREAVCKVSCGQRAAPPAAAAGPACARIPTGSVPNPTQPNFNPACTRTRLAQAEWLHNQGKACQVSSGRGQVQGAG